MAKSSPIIRIPESALDEFSIVEKMDWSGGIPLESMLKWVNQVAARFRPEGIGGSSRASADFTPRTFRHYQTLGCIDAPEKAGRQAVYGFRHYVQALLLRKLVWERMPSEKIIALMAGRSTGELKQLLFKGIEIVARESEQTGESASPKAEHWKRIDVIPGVELHLRGDLAKPKPAELKEWLAQLETALRTNL